MFWGLNEEQPCNHKHASAAQNYDNVYVASFSFCVLEHRSLTILWVQAHFEEALTVRHRGSDSKKLVSKGVRGKSASEKLSEETLVKLSSRVKMQVTLNTIYVILLMK